MRIEYVTIDCANPKILARFWAEVLDWETTYESDSEVIIELQDGSPAVGLIPNLLFIKNPDNKVAKNRLHLDLRPEDQDLEVARLEKLGATKIDIGQYADKATTWVVMADPEGNEFCVLSKST